MKKCKSPEWQWMSDKDVECIRLLWQHNLQKSTLIGICNFMSWWTRYNKFHIYTSLLVKLLPYNLESNPHPFYSFRGLENQMRITIACRLDSRSRAGFWKNDRAAIYVLQEQYSTIIYYFIYYSSDSPSRCLVFPPQSNVAFINSNNCDFHSPLRTE
jgi:hypothetical protein